MLRSGVEKTIACARLGIWTIYGILEEVLEHHPRSRLTWDGEKIKCLKSRQKTILKLNHYGTKDAAAS